MQCSMKMHEDQHRYHLAHQVLLSEMHLMGKIMPLRQVDLHTGDAECLRVISKLPNKLKM